MGRRPDDAPAYRRITPAPPETAAVAWGRVFAGDDFSRNPFVVSLGLVGAFCPVDDGALRADQFHALAKAARAVGDDRFLLSAGTGGRHPPDGHWECRLPHYREYAALTRWIGAGDVALYSPRGLWGVAVAAQGYALIGGPGRLREVIGELYDLTASWSRFVAMLPRRP
jgi:hypothetical protein